MMVAALAPEVKCLVPCMDLNVAETLERIRDLKSPVARTGHIGNNAANNWGWLALAGNTYLLQWEHSLYGVDDIFAPWMVLGDGGVVEACYDALGAPQPEAVGRHVTEVFRRCDPKYVRHLTYGIFAEHAGGDLISHHCRLAAHMSARLGSSPSAFAASELLGMRDLLSRTIRDLCRTRNLHLLFNRWVRQSRKGFLIALKLRGIEYHGPEEVSLHTMDSMLMFRGSIDSLIDLFFEGMRDLAERMTSGRNPSFRHYPWIKGSALYLTRAMREHDVDPGQETFWHAGGATSTFYVQEDEVSGYLTDFRDTLARLGYLPSGLQIQLIPTFCAQFFATRPESLAVLESLLEVWQGLLRRQGEVARRCLEVFASRSDPRQVAEEFCRTLGNSALRELQTRLEEFNALDPHQLPIAYAKSCEHPTYNKYGIAQHHLLEATPLFPAPLRSMTWGEAELLAKVLAQIAIDRQG